MIDFLKGEIAAKRPTEVILQVGGIGYKLHIPLSTYEALPESGEATLLTYLQVREDALKLYGFATRSEREMFELLLSVSGVGPGIALTALSGSSVEQLREVILAENVAALSRIKGIGKKTAQRIVVDVAESVRGVAGAEEVRRPTPKQNVEDTILALLSLGYVRANAELAVERALKGLGADAKTEDLLREALSSS